MGGNPWVEVVAGALGIAVQIARALGGDEGEQVARRVEDVLRDAGFPALRRAALDVADEARDRLRGGAFVP